MSLKLCFGNEIHRVAKLPVSINALKETIQSIFSGRLPDTFAIHYTDCDGDKIIMTSQEDYEALLVDYRNDPSNKAVKIFISTPSSEKSNDTSVMLSDVTVASQHNNQVHDYSIIKKDESALESGSNDLVNAKERDEVIVNA